MNRRTLTPAVALPPQFGLHARHAMALRVLLNELQNHFVSYAGMFIDDDGPFNEIQDSFVEIDNVLLNAMESVLLNPPGDTAWMEAVKAARDNADYKPVENLFDAVTALSRKASN